MGKPNIAIRCYISQFTYNLQNLLFLPDRFFRWSPAKKCCRYTSLSVSVSPRARSIYLIFFSWCCCCCGCCVSRDSPAMMSTRDTIHLLHASPSRDLMPPVAVSLSLCCAVRTLEKCHEFHTSAFRSTWPTRFFEGVTSALSPVSDLRRYWYYYYVPLRWSITTGQDNRAHEALLLAAAGDVVPIRYCQSSGFPWGRWIRRQLKMSNFEFFSHSASPPPPKNHTCPLTLAIHFFG